jgi:hypothetical protein
LPDYTGNTAFWNTYGKYHADFGWEIFRSCNVWYLIIQTQKGKQEHFVYSRLSDMKNDYNFHEIDDRRQLCDP